MRRRSEGVPVAEAAWAKAVHVTIESTVRHLGVEDALALSEGTVI
ncbi:hypothetical protein ACRAWG_12040 [Methylobacterium sp. P31]